MPPIKHDSNADIFRGQLFLFINDKPIAYGKDASLSLATDEVDVSNKMISGGWKASLPGQNSYTISSESLLTQKTGQLSFDTLMEAYIKKDTLPFVLGEAIVTNQTTTGGEFTLDTSKPHYKGIMMITSLDLKSTDGDIATCSASVAGSGAIEKGASTPTT